MPRVTRVIAAVLAAIMHAAFATAQEDDGPTAETVVQPAVDDVFEAFQSRPLVGLGDEHGLAQGMEFYAAIVRDPRFAAEVGNVVVEFGAAGRQDVIDRYVAGETVPYAELRTVWTDTVGWFPTAGYLGFAEFFAAVRETNMALLPNERIRVWLGEPPIDWSEVTSDERFDAMRSRDSHAASLIVDNILANDEKALVIYGHLHYARNELGPGNSSLLSRVEAERPDAFFVVLPYSGIHEPPACAPYLEQVAQIWPTPALIAGVHDARHRRARLPDRVACRSSRRRRRRCRVPHPSRNAR